MSAILGRINPELIHDRKNPRLQMEFLKRVEALFAPQEWEWTVDRDAAHCWQGEQGRELATHFLAQHHGEPMFYGAYVAPPQAPGDTRLLGKRAVVSPVVSLHEVGLDRKKDVETAERAAGERRAEPERDATKGVAPGETASRDISGRIAAARQNKRVARARKLKVTPPEPPRDGASSWQKIFTERVAPTEVFSDLEKRGLA